MIVFISCLPWFCHFRPVLTGNFNIYRGLFHNLIVYFDYYNILFWFSVTSSLQEHHSRLSHSTALLYSRLLLQILVFKILVFYLFRREMAPLWFFENPMDDETGRLQFMGLKESDMIEQSQFQTTKKPAWDQESWWSSHQSRNSWAATTRCSIWQVCFLVICTSFQ